MEKFAATDVTILILFRGDSIQRLENLLSVVNYICKVCETNIYIREATRFNNGILNQLLCHHIKYEFINDDDPVLHKTKHFNEMLQRVETPFVTIWDADTIAYKEEFQKCVEKLRSNEVQIAFPYNGVCLDTSEIIRELYFKNDNFSVLHNNLQKMSRLQNHILTGGAVFMNKDVFSDLGGENEAYYGWGDDDYDRYIRFMNAGCGIYRGSTVLYHLSHPRGINSGFNSNINQITSKGVLFKTVHKI